MVNHCLGDGLNCERYDGGRHKKPKKGHPQTDVTHSSIWTSETEGFGRPDRTVFKTDEVGQGGVSKKVPYKKVANSKYE